MAEQRKKTAETADDGGASDGIAWTQETWNPVMGCSKVSAGCTHCYAERMAARFSGEGQPFHGLSDGKRWTGKVRFRTDRLGQPLRWTRPRLVFVNSVSDLFHEGLLFEEIAVIFGVMSLAKAHTFQVLTKRPARMLDFFAWLDEQAREKAANSPLLSQDQARLEVLWEYAAEFEPIRGRIGWYPAWPLPNVWLGVSAEDQDAANARIPLLLRAPAAVRWVSAEPLIGPLDLGKIPDPSWYTDEGADYYNALGGYEGWKAGLMSLKNSGIYGPRLDWVVVGGESGHGARECRRKWLWDIVLDCHHARVPVFVKQLGARYADPGNGFAGAAVKDTAGYGVRRLTHPKGGDVSEWPEALRVRQWPKGYKAGEGT